MRAHLVTSAAIALVLTKCSDNESKATPEQITVQ
jgi:hypothetical protein